MSKNALQELLQRRGLPVPTYSVGRVGPSHGPVFTSQVTVKWKNGETLQAKGDGRKKIKEAEMEAARKMLEILRAKEGLGSSARSPPPSVLRGACSSFPSPGSHSNCKGQLQEYLQQFGHPPPQYSVVRGTVNQQYVVKCVAITSDGRIIAEEHGNGRRKTDAEKAAAENVFPLVKEVLNSGRPLSHVSTSSLSLFPGVGHVERTPDQGLGARLNLSDCSLLVLPYATPVTAAPSPQA